MSSRIRGESGVRASRLRHELRESLFETSLEYWVRTRKLGFDNLVVASSGLARFAFALGFPYNIPIRFINTLINHVKAHLS